MREVSVYFIYNTCTTFSGRRHGEVGVSTSYTIHVPHTMADVTVRERSVLHPYNTGIFVAPNVTSDTISTHRHCQAQNNWSTPYLSNGSAYVVFSPSDCSTSPLLCASLSVVSRTCIRYGWQGHLNLEMLLFCYCPVFQQVW